MKVGDSLVQRIPTYVNNFTTGISDGLWQSPCYYYIGVLSPEVLLKRNYSSDAIGWIPGIVVKEEGSAVPVLPDYTDYQYN
uniref:Uncharacterized protein n=1 Tax=Salix viminalis TaxID=40686 RepID=A0A6N2M6U1_SALVM